MSTETPAVPVTRFNGNPHRISLKEFRKREGLLTSDAYLSALEEYVFDGVAPALCREGCAVEPDGECVHGCPSILIVEGLI